MLTQITKLDADVDNNVINVLFYKSTSHGTGKQKTFIHSTYAAVLLHVITVGTVVLTNGVIDI